MDIRDVQGRLELRLDELLARAGHIGADLLGLHSADAEDAAVEVQADEPLLGQSALLEQEIEQVRAALSRLQGGSYGVCISCGADIRPARLEAMPEATHCILCAAPRGKG
jgi:RNA polymerase-binding transcription factor DksA